MNLRILNKFNITKNNLGKTVISREDFEPGNIILQFQGEIVPRKNLPSNTTGEFDRFVQIAPDLFMGPSLEADDYINHSCDPNAGINFTGDAVYLVAIKPIKKGEEITWDYSTTIYNDNWTMDCLCGAQVCRGRVYEFLKLPQDIQKKYIDNIYDIVPKYIRDVYNIKIK